MTVTCSHNGKVDLLSVNGRIINNPTAIIGVKTISSGVGILAIIPARISRHGLGLLLLEKAKN